jgi:hypothetical protein
MSLTLIKPYVYLLVSLINTEIVIYTELHTQIGYQSQQMALQLLERVTFWTVQLAIP